MRRWELPKCGDRLWRSGKIALARGSCVMRGTGLEQAGHPIVTLSGAL